MLRSGNDRPSSTSCRQVNKERNGPVRDTPLLQHRVWMGEMTVGEDKKEDVQTSDENSAASIACLEEKVLHISNELDQFSWMFGHFSAIEEGARMMI